MTWQHITDAPTTFARLADTILRIRRVELSRHIRHLERMVQSHSTTLAKQPGGLEQVEKTLTLMRDLRRKLGETCG